MKLKSDNPIAIIKRDHREVEALYKKYKGFGAKAFKSKQKTANEIIDALTVHAEMEEKLFYPKVEQKFNQEDDKMVAEAYTEHSVIKKLMKDIKSSNPEDAEFDANVKVLMETVKHHVKEEENELLPESQKQLSDEEMDAIGEKMKSFKEGKETMKKNIQKVKKALGIKKI